MEKRKLAKQEACIKIENLGLEKKTVAKLKRVGINYLGQLLKLDYQRLGNIRQLGKIGKRDIIKSIHSLGYEFENEEVDQELIIEELKQDGVIVLEDYSFPKKAYSLLYREGIYTIEDLTKNWDKIKEIKYFGPERQQILLNVLKEHHIDIKKPEAEAEKPEELSEITLEIYNKQLKEENTTLQTRIDNKERLLAEYKQLLNEKLELIEKERALDEQLEKIRGDINAKGIQYKK